MGLFSFFRRPRDTSATIAKERLQIVLSHERASRDAPDFLPILQKELVAVVARFVEVRDDTIRVNVGKSGETRVLEINIEIDGAKLALTAAGKGPKRPVVARFGPPTAPRPAATTLVPKPAPPLVPKPAPPPAKPAASPPVAKPAVSTPVAPKPAEVPKPAGSKPEEPTPPETPGDSEPGLPKPPAKPAAAKPPASVEESDPEENSAPATPPAAKNEDAQSPARAAKSS